MAIARTILRNPPVLVLDEATSSLDTQTEAAIGAELERAIARSHDDRDRPPALDGPRRRPDRGARCGIDRRAGHALRADGAGRRVRSARGARRDRGARRLGPGCGAAPLRIATWNVNSLKQRVPRLCRGSISAGPTWSVSRRPSARTPPSPSYCRTCWPNAATKRLCTGRRRGTAWRSCRVSAWRMSCGASRGLLGFPTPRRERCRRPAAGSASSRCTCPTGGSPDSEHYHYKLAWLAVAAGHGRRRSGGDWSCAAT